MPQFIKMGLGGTGYLGEKENSLRSAKKRAARRKVLEGFPIHEPFKSIEDVREYLSGDRVICLLCGKGYKRLGGTHLQKIHGITEDQYREKYNIPWTYALVCQDTKEKYRDATNKRIEEGYVPPMKVGSEHKILIGAPKRKRAFAKEVGINNLGELAKPKSDKEKRPPSKRGSKEFKEKMQARPQCQPDFTRKVLGSYWKGKKQTPEHIRKRTGKI